MSTARGSRAPTPSSGGGAASRAPTLSSGGGAASRDPTPSSGGGAASRDPTPSDAATGEPTQETQGTDVVEVDSGDDDHVIVGSKRRLKSAVWQDFEKVKVKGEWKAICNWCHKKLSAAGRSGTKHLHGHIASCESRQIKRVVVEKYVFDQAVARKELALMICVHEYPLSMVDHVGFRKFCAALQPLFKVVSRNTIRKDILEMYEVQRLSIMKQFQQEQSRIAVTTDMWTATKWCCSRLDATAATLPHYHVITGITAYSKSSFNAGLGVLDLKWRSITTGSN
ncbi:hypothetical protein HU200_049147 [Digitaria exilis]|uniref:BED-type domain-containing protein n=1 Tax=Digitaria exilis TaxID=1010633 RepID=A0A835AU96_9POAL|nr:hypothetical protein HU200_049147 [Digitaria exilis]